jgi:uncharacterized protein (TIGR00255 family)
MNSMTGYGMAMFSLDKQTVEIEVSSVNKRHLEVVVSVPKEWQRFEYDATKKIKSFFERGRIRVSINVAKNSENEVELLFEDSLIEKDLASLELFLSKKNQSFKLSPELILQLADLRKNQTKLPALEKVQNNLEQTLYNACQKMLEMRTNEGNSIKDDLKARISCLSQYFLEMEKNSGGMAEEHRVKLLAKLEKSDLSIEQDDERILKEVALFAEKSDTSEEITRLHSHLGQMSKTIEDKGCIGRKIEFLLQEISRELNTFCSKSTRTSCTNIALNARTEVEKMREQSLNIE